MKPPHSLRSGGKHLALVTEMEGSDDNDTLLTILAVTEGSMTAIMISMQTRRLQVRLSNPCCYHAAVSWWLCCCMRHA